MIIDLKQVSNLVFDQVNGNDWPDFSDAIISSGDYRDRELTEDEIDFINENHSDFVHDALINDLF
jgi:hypothetical protein